MRKLILLLCILLVSSFVFGQRVKNDTIPLNKSKAFNYKTLIIPTTLIGFGFLGLENVGIKNLNYDIQKKIYADNHSKFKINDYSQYAPFVSVYALNAIDFKGKNNFKDRTIVLCTAYLIMGLSVKGTKRLIAIERPDHSDKNSFPSGHAATAFMGAEFLWQEYKDVSLWYGIAGYIVATGTGFMRMYNNSHWFTDVVAGAGFGILSTKIAYWVHPFLKKTFFTNKKDISGLVMPFYNGKGYGLALSITI